MAAERQELLMLECPSGTPRARIFFRCWHRSAVKIYERRSLSPTSPRPSPRVLNRFARKSHGVSARPPLGIFKIRAAVPKIRGANSVCDLVSAAIFVCELTCTSLHKRICTRLHRHYVSFTMNYLQFFGEVRGLTFSFCNFSI